MSGPADVLSFWFGEPPTAQPRGEWFRKDPSFDARIRSHFAAAIEAALAGGLREWDATPAGALTDDTLRRLYHRAHTLLRHNLHPGVRSTTGRAEPRTWVYERAGRSCLVCGGAITAYEDPVDQRWTWWCPTCQPLPHRSGTSA